MRVRAILEISNNDGKIWKKLNNGKHVELTNTGMAFDIDRF